MYIVFVTAFFAENEEKPLAGMPGYIYKVSKLLIQRGHEVEIIAGAGFSKKWKYKGLTVYNCGVPQELEGNVFGISRKILQREFAFQKKLQEINRNKEIDIVQYAGWSGVGCLHSLKCPGILRISTYSRIQYKKSEIFKHVECYSFWERMAGRHADGILSPSIVLGEHLGHDIHKKVVIMETPYDINVAEDESLFKNKLAGKNYILFYGQTSIEKGFVVIEDMMLEFLQQNGDAYFVVAGWNSPQGGSDAVSILRKKLGRYAERFIYLGPINQSMLFPIIRGAKCVLIPSLIDNLPNSCLEALCLGQIVIGTYGTSLEQLVIDNVNGFLVAPGNSKELLRAVIQAYHLREEKRQSMITNSKSTIEQFSPEVAVAKLEKYYNWSIKQYKGKTK